VPLDLTNKDVEALEIGMDQRACALENVEVGYMVFKEPPYALSQCCTETVPALACKQEVFKRRQEVHILKVFDNCEVRTEKPRSWKGVGADVGQRDADLMGTGSTSSFVL
jgi:hypothetical protein